MAAPTRRAPPVISTVLPVRLWSCSFTMHSMTSPASVTTLPPLSADERAHSERVVGAHPRVHAAAGRRHRLRCLHAAGAVRAGPRLLQRRRRPSSAASGDFVTAPEMSSLFSRCLARQSADVLRVTGGDILELGAGFGPHGRRRAHRAGGARLPAGALSHPRSERGSRRAPARAHRAAAARSSRSGCSG